MPTTNVAALANVALGNVVETPISKTIALNLVPVVSNGSQQVTSATLLVANTSLQAPLPSSHVVGIKSTQIGTSVTQLLVPHYWWPVLFHSQYPLHSQMLMLLFLICHCCQLVYLKVKH